MFKKFHNNKYTRGVTLVELLVVIAIMAIMSATTLVSYSKFRSTMSIQNLADDIALSVRKAQGYAIGVSKNKESKIYGVHFSVKSGNSPHLGSKKAFVLFADVNENKKYDHNTDGSCGISSIEECLEILNITSTDEIDSINYYTSGGAGGAGGAGRDDRFRPNPIANGSIDIVFKRPNPEPTFCYKGNASIPGCNADEDIYYIEIKVKNTKNPGTYRTVKIWNNGQISVS